MIKMSNGNSNKIHYNQIKVCQALSEQISGGDRNILGEMIESNIKSGNQKLIDKDKLEWGVSITDACIDMNTTNKLLDQLYKSLSIRFRKRKRTDI